MRNTALTRIFLASIASLFTLGSIVACSTVLGIQDVKPKGSTKKDGAKEEEEDDADRRTVPQPEEDAQVNLRANVFQVALGDAHTCARKPEGTVRCWGDDVQGQTGGGTLAPGGIAQPHDVAGITDAVDIAAGKSHTCVVHKTGKVSCWGFNLDGQLGNGETGNRSAAPVEVSNLSNAFAIAAGGNFTCALRGSGLVTCWGANGSGQLGNGGDQPSATPVDVKGLSNIASIAAGLAHVCVATKPGMATQAGTVSCWGEGGNGQLGKALPNSATPAAVDGITDARFVAAGERWSCAVTATNLKCWGANELGQLGSGTPNPTPSPTPVTVLNLTDAETLLGGRGHMCAARKTGSVACWGGGGRGQLGDGKARTPTEPTATFVLASGVTEAVSGGAAGNHSCAATPTQVFCWGANDRGQLGIDSTNDTNIPSVVP